MAADQAAILRQEAASLVESILTGLQAEKPEEVKEEDEEELVSSTAPPDKDTVSPLLPIPFTINVSMCHSCLNL